MAPCITPNICWVDGTASFVPSEIGGKAFGLNRLITWRFDVPSFFVVLGGQKLTPGFSSEIAMAADKLAGKEQGGALFAVRSSASVEDGINSSFAGMFNTYLSVSRAALVPRIADCRNSLRNERTREYAERCRVNLETVVVNVIVQRMIQAEYSGVAFSIDPVFRDSNLMVVELVRGSGEKLVAGHVTPDTVRIEKRTEEIVGIEWGECGLSGDSDLASRLIRIIARNVLEIEMRFGASVDVEFAIKGSALYLLQARPITALRPESLTVFG